MCALPPHYLKEPSTLSKARKHWNEARKKKRKQYAPKRNATRVSNVLSRWFQEVPARVSKRFWQGSGRFQHGSSTLPRRSQDSSKTVSARFRQGCIFVHHSPAPEIETQHYLCWEYLPKDRRTYEAVARFPLAKIFRSFWHASFGHNFKCCFGHFEVHLWPILSLLRMFGGGWLQVENHGCNMVIIIWCNYCLFLFLLARRTQDAGFCLNLSEFVVAVLVFCNKSQLS